MLAEIGVRALAWSTEAGRREAWYGLDRQPVLPSGAEAALVHLIRPSRNEQRIYELLPGLDVRFQGHVVRTDDRGHRVGARVDTTSGEPASGDAEPVRIVGIGDSVMFGWGVAEPDCFLRQLEGLLRQQHPEVAWQAINTGVPGYNTVMEVATLREALPALAPRLVVLDVVGNDLDLPNFIAHDSDHLDPTTSYVLELVVSVVRGFETQPFRPLQLAPKRAEGLFVGDPASVPARYRDMVGEPAFRRAVAELASLARTHRFELLATSHLWLSDWARKALDDVGIAHVEVGPAVARYQETNGIADYRGGMTTRPDDPHPGAVVHRLHAEAIRDALARSGALARLLGPR